MLPASTPPKRTFPQRLTARGEMVAVLSLAFAYLVIASAISAMAPSRSVLLGGDWFWLLAYEIAAGVAVAGILAERGWRPRDLGLVLPSSARAVVLDVLGGILLAGAAIVVNGIAQITLMMAGLANGTAFGLDASGLGLGTGIALVAVNVLFEETLVCAYVVVALRARPDLALFTSATLRAAYHTYQGPAATAGIVAMGLVFAEAFRRWRRVAPLAIAHALLLVSALLRAGW